MTGPVWLLRRGEKLITFGAIYSLFGVTVCFMDFEFGPESRTVFREFLAQIGIIYRSGWCLSGWYPSGKSH